MARRKRALIGILCAVLSACLVGAAVWLWQSSAMLQPAEESVAQEPNVAEEPADEQSEPEPEEDPSPITYVPSGSCRLPYTFSYVRLHRIFRDYVLSRVQPLAFTYDYNKSYGPWEAYDDFAAEEADNNGQLTQWDDAYFVCHDWSEYGQQILMMVPGDTVTISGRTIEVQGAFDYPKDAYLSEIRELLGYDDLILQTCEPASDLNRIVYGH